MESLKTGRLEIGDFRLWKDFEKLSETILLFLDAAS